MLRLDEGIVHSVPKKMIDMLPLSTFVEANLENFSDENKACTICMCIYEKGEQYIILPCLHRFHKKCICTWFERKNTCPNCKDKVVAHFNEQIVQIRSSTAQVPIPAQNINYLNPFSDVLDDREEYLQRMNRGNPSNFRISHFHFNEQWRSIPRPAI